MSSSQLEEHKEDVILAANRFIQDRSQQNRSQFIDLDAALLSEGLFVIRPTAESRQKVTVKFASDHLQAFVTRAYARRGY
jgi:hypothetical protein